MPSSTKSSDRLGAEARGRAGNGGGMARSASVTGNRFGAPSASAQASAVQRNAPTNGMFGGQGGLNARRTANPTPSYDPSLHNFVELGKFAMPGPGLVAGAGRMVAGYGPDFTGYRGQINGPGDYDPKDRPLGMSMGGAPTGFNGALTPAAYQAMLAARNPRPGIPATAGAGATGPVPPYLMRSTVPAATLGGPIPGLQNYMQNVPSYGYFGLPGQRRPPKAAMFGGF